MALCDVPEPVEGKKPTGVRRTRRDRGGSTKERLILAAIALSAQKGFSNVPLREVVEKAECHNISAVHYHFKNRNGLLEAVLNMIDRNWAIEIPGYAKRGGIFDVLYAFALSLDDLKRASQWGSTVIKFLTRLAMDEDPATADAATAFLATRLSAVHDAIAPHCPDIDPATLRLRVGNACLLLLTVSSQLDRSCLAALGCGTLAEGMDTLPRETVRMAAAIISGTGQEEENDDADSWLEETPHHAIDLSASRHASLSEQAVA